VTATCRKELRDVLPAVEVSGEVATTVALAVCTFAGAVPDPLDSYATTEILLGGGTGVRSIANDPEWGPPTAAVRVSE
jgi:hypothetical protein